MLLLAAASSMSACIIPVAPDFQDPPSQPDSPPSLANPLVNLMLSYFGATISLQQGNGDTTFSASVSDPDPGTKLQIRWALDYPPYNPATTSVFEGGFISAPVPGQPIQNVSVSQTINCSSVRDFTKSTQRFVLIVADGKLAEPDPNQPYGLVQVVTSGNAVSNDWEISVNCPVTQPTQTTP